MSVLVIGGGPAGLMAAEALSKAGLSVEVCDAMASVGRKFLLAGKGGLNLTHSEPLEAFAGRYSHARPAAWLQILSPEKIREWARGLGVETFVGTSGRVFPSEMKAAPLLRSWLRRLRAGGVDIRQRWRWEGWTAGGELRFATPEGEQRRSPQAVVLALGGGSWPRLGSDGAWVSWLRGKGISVAELQPSNCGFEVAWSAVMRERFAGCPLKSVEIEGRRGDCVVSDYGLEGSLLYPFSPGWREEIARNGSAILHLDLVPDRPLERLRRELARPRGSNSLAKHLGRAGLEGVKAALVREILPDLSNAEQVAETAKHLPLRLLAPRPLEEAISSAGGVAFEELDDQLMLKRLPGVFCAGEMIDWEAPTGGYLLTACLASGLVAGCGAVEYLRLQRSNL
ncbi:MAG: TIGR03862 family flavoprotein [Candidatus Eremiobacteraeota bacterium]|nr:TIGR03862 family flavoprotein [Candidatus Eremiobacteraeota bacterium]MCW5867893.1 TIGR03862 family flavoprotein [Candidatus Eremiobacteraeota bacterium]